MTTLGGGLVRARRDGLLVIFLDFVFCILYNFGVNGDLLYHIPGTRSRDALLSAASSVLIFFFLKLFINRKYGVGGGGRTHVLHFGLVRPLTTRHFPYGRTYQ